jgi:tetratricopeptide (TPR) repeat protein
MPDPVARLGEIAAAVADGTSVDWDRVVEDVSSDEAREDVDALRLVARIADVHGSASWADRSAGSTSGSEALGPGAPSRSDLVRWGPLQRLQLIGHGTFGDVYRAWDPRLEREVALKLLRGVRVRTGVEGAALDAVVVHEARLLARVRHPGVATIFGADHIDGRTGLWMELVQGHTLEDELARDGPLPPDAVARCGVAVADAVVAVHRAGLLHRDIKTQNVMREADGRVVLMDFGTGLDHEAPEEPRALAGTPLYLSPEVLAGAPPTPQSDLYSLGVVLFRLATGEYPVPGRTLREVRSAHARGLKRTLASVRPDLPPPLTRAIDRALATRPDHRFDGAEAMRDALSAAIAGVSHAAHAAPAAPTKHWWLTSGKPARAVVAATLLAGVAATALFLGEFRHTSTSTPPLAFAPRDWVLVTALENRAGIDVFDGTLEYVLRQELASSPIVQVASPDRVRDALALMRRAPDTKVDLEVGREVSLRDGGIRALVAARVDRVGPRLRLSTDLVAPQDGRIVASDARLVDGEGMMLEAVAAQAGWVRRMLGEPLPELPSPTSFQRATTSSLAALQVYSKAVDLGRQNQWAPALKLLESAVQYDPQFASAHNLLAWAISNTGGPWPAVSSAAERARTLAAESSEAERYFIEGSYFTFLGSSPGAEGAYDRFAQAAAAFEALLQIEPGHYWGALNLLNHYGVLQRQDDAVPLAVELATSRPNDVSMQVVAARALVSWKASVGPAAEYVERAQALVHAGAAARPPEVSWIELFAAHRAWVEGDVERARQITDRVAATLSGRPMALLQESARRVGGLYVTLGRCHDARSAYERTHPNMRHEALAMLAWECGDPSGFVAHMRADARATSDPSYWRIMWGARSGDVREAQQWVDDFRRQRSNRIVLAVADGELAFARGAWTEAIEHLEEAWHYLKNTGQERTCRVAERLAGAHRMLGRTDRALEVLEATVAMRPRLYDTDGVHGGMPWIRAQLALADLYRALGRHRDAETVEDTVRPLLRVADPDLPLLAALNRRGQ